MTIGRRRGALVTKPSRVQSEEAELNALERSIEAGNYRLQTVLNQFAARATGQSSFSEKIRQVQEIRSITADFCQLPVPAVLIYTLVADDRYIAVLFTPDIQKSYEYRIKPADLSRKVYELRQVVQDPRSDPLPAARELYGILVGPEMENDLRQSGAKLVMWSLDGVLRYVPLAAIHDGRQFFIERYSLAVFTPPRFRILVSTRGPS